MKKLLGVTGCPTGIAHTFMAEEALKKAAAELGCEIKVETNGAAGAENQLTAEDIKEAAAIIVACDKNVDMDRFNGKPVIEVSVSDGINKAEELIRKCMDGLAPVREGAVRENNDNNKGQSVGHTIYKHLMSGVSHMLPLVVAGGVLTAISFLWGIYSADPTSDQYNAIAAMLKTVGGYSMNLMVPVLAAFIAQSISGRPGMLAGLVGGVIASETGSGFIGGIAAGFLAGYFVEFLLRLMHRMPRQLEGLKSIFLIPIISVGVIGTIMVLIGTPCSALNNALMNFLENLQDSSPVLLGIVIGCMSAFDMGGPVNKAAYVTGTMLLGQGNYFFMAGVSAACITPPLIIAIAATFFKNRFTKEDRTAGLLNYILGCTHITEGAIPFAAKNPLKVIPVLMAGSSISAVLTYILQIEVPAPHGGFLILGLVNKPLLWVVCILVGSAVGALLYVAVTPVVITEIRGKETGQKENNRILFSSETITMDLKGETKDEVIQEMADLLEADGVLKDKEAYIQAIYEREKQSTTGMGMGIAIPHAKTSAVKVPRAAVGISKKGFDFDSEDGKPAHIIFMIAVTEKDQNLHLDTLAKLSGKVMHEEFREALKNAESKEKIMELLMK
ncbi:MAG TPA: fructose-specific PTS transporter subunit EIIC [Candidatus Anaerostipes excrementavium]|uniref:Fructose-specific PTS transporter subunit EIIC n=1 Tax=Candidatus Anaerostipes excrementavium TaxID=2838463 RepID=A0A9D1WUW8_9FIRM|nr:fructose-specific PTS transporter subunit EIIC [uncultured Anaerostipes sp.]HIX67624.1 fructose-specific PTS transporter subunit EIIC [Candidatus Anaerostipes excrementavium]